MASKFVVPVRDQPFMEFVSYHERLGDDHLVWTVIDVVEGLDLSLVHDRYAPDVGAGGRPAFDPAMMLSLLIFGYCEGKRSSRELEDACRRDWAYRAICGDLEPDHATIARFRVRLDDLLKGLFGQVLMVCANAGMIDVSVVAVDGTRMGSVASKEANRTITTLAEMEVAARCMLDEAAQADGNDPDLGLDADHDADPGSVSVTDVVTGPDPDVGLVLGLDTDHDPGSVGLDADHDPGPGSVSGSGRVSSVSRRRNEQVRRAGRVVEANQVVCDGEASRVAEETKRQKPKRLVANVTDPESRLQKTRRGFIQGYNAQAVVSADQVVIACDVTNNTTDQAQLEPMLGAAKTNVGAAGITVAIGSALADAGYASYTNFEAESRLGMSLLIATSRGAKIAKCDVERSDTERDSERIELFQRIDRIGKAFEPVTAHDQDIVNATVLQL